MSLVQKVSGTHSRSLRKTFGVVPRAESHLMQVAESPLTAGTGGRHENRWGYLPNSYVEVAVVPLVTIAPLATASSGNILERSCEL